jgi:hypothetical protein
VQFADEWQRAVGDCQRAAQSLAHDQHPTRIFERHWRDSSWSVSSPCSLRNSRIVTHRGIPRQSRPALLQLGNARARMQPGAVDNLLEPSERGHQARLTVMEPLRYPSVLRAWAAFVHPRFRNRGKHDGGKCLPSLKGCQ